MSTLRNSRVNAALTLIAIGAWFLAVQISPAVNEWAYGRYTWPIPIIGIGAGLLAIGLLTGQAGMAVPACIVGGVGGLLYWQNLTDNWGSWAYAWALIPGFVGVGIVLAGLLGGRLRQELAAGGTLVGISLALFVVFGSFLGGSELVGVYWPVALIVVGGLLLVGTAARTRR